MLPAAFVRPLWPATQRFLRLLTRLAMTAVVLAAGFGAGQPAIAGPAAFTGSSTFTGSSALPGSSAITGPSAAVASIHFGSPQAAPVRLRPTAGSTAVGLPSVTPARSTADLTTQAVAARAARPVPDLTAPSAAEPPPVAVADAPTDDPGGSATGVRGPPLR